MRRVKAVTLVALGVAAVLAAPSAEAKAPYMMKAGPAGVKDVVKTCASCHASAKPTKEKWDLNDLGHWLEKQKKDKGAKEVDLAWVKDYKK